MRQEGRVPPAVILTFLLSSALPQVCLRTDCLIFSILFSIFSHSALPFQHPTSFSPLHAEGKNADSTVIIQLDLLMGTVQAVLNSLPTKDKEILSRIAQIVSSYILIYQCYMQGCWQFTEQEGDALIHLNSGLPVTSFPDN